MKTSVSGDPHLRSSFRRHNYSQLQKGNPALTTERLAVLIQSCSPVPEVKRSRTSRGGKDPVTRRREIQQRRKRLMMIHHMRTFMPAMDPPTSSLDRVHEGRVETKSKDLIKLMRLRSSYHQIRPVSGKPQHGKLRERQVSQHFGRSSSLTNFIPPLSEPARLKVERKARRKKYQQVRTISDITQEVMVDKIREKYANQPFQRSTSMGNVGPSLREVQSQPEPKPETKFRKERVSQPGSVSVFEVALPGVAIAAKFVQDEENRRRAPEERNQRQEQEEKHQRQRQEEHYQRQSRRSKEMFQRKELEVKFQRKEFEKITQRLGPEKNNQRMFPEETKRFYLPFVINLDQGPENINQRQRPEAEKQHHVPDNKNQRHVLEIKNQRQVPYEKSQCQDPAKEVQALSTDVESESDDDQSLSTEVGSDLDHVQALLVDLDSSEDIPTLLAEAESESDSVQDSSTEIESELEAVQTLPGKAESETKGFQAFSTEDESDADDVQDAPTKGENKSEDAQAFWKDVESEPNDVKVPYTEFESEPDDVQAPYTEVDSEPVDDVQAPYTEVECEPDDVQTPYTEVECEPDDVQAPYTEVECDPDDVESPDTEADSEEDDHAVWTDVESDEDVPGLKDAESEEDVEGLLTIVEDESEVQEHWQDLHSDSEDAVPDNSCRNCRRSSRLLLLQALHIRRLKSNLHKVRRIAKSSSYRLTRLESEVGKYADSKSLLELADVEEVQDSDSLPRLQPVVLVDKHPDPHSAHYHVRRPIAYLQQDLEARAGEVLINGHDHLDHFLEFLRQKCTMRKVEPDPILVTNIRAFVAQKDLMIRHMEKMSSDVLKVGDILDRFEAITMVLPMDPLKNLFYIHVKEFMRKYPPWKYGNGSMSMPRTVPAEDSQATEMVLEEQSEEDPNFTEKTGFLSKMKQKIFSRSRSRKKVEIGLETAKSEEEAWSRYFRATDEA